MTLAGRGAVLAVVLTALVGGVAMWWTQTRAFYVTLDAPEMTVVAADGEHEVAVKGFRGIEKTSSPIGYRSCLRVDTGDFKGAVPARDAVPLTAPHWFGCFDAEAIGTALERGEARAVLSRENTPYGIDRVIALYPDGRGYAWTQINHCGEVVFDGRPAPEGCPPPPGKS